MKNYKIKLLKKEVIAERTFAFYFTKPVGFKFKAGNYGKFTLINPKKTDIKGNTRSFSFASTPDDEELMIVLRMRDSAYKKELNDHPIGTEIALLAPIMMIQLKMNSNRPVVFLCGGVGVSVARSMIIDALQSGFSEKIVLLNSNRTFERIVFLNEFREKAAKNPNFMYVPTITGKTVSKDWSGKEGYIDEQMITVYTADLKNPIYYITGTNRFVWDMYKLLKSLKISDSNINFDEFTGY